VLQAKLGSPDLWVFKAQPQQSPTKARVWRIRAPFATRISGDLSCQGRKQGYTSQ
jgi:hypothetical protein